MGVHTVVARFSGPGHPPHQGITSITVTVRTTSDPHAMARLVRTMMGRTSETVPRS